MTTGPENPIPLGKSGLPKSGLSSSKTLSSAKLGSLHVVSPGQNLAIIAAEFGISVEALTKANGLSEISLIFPGQKILIPVPVQEELELKPPTEHVVALGESVFALAARFGISVAVLQKLNNLSDSAILFPGTKLKLVDDKVQELEKKPAKLERPFPAQCLVHGYHVVKTGDQPSRVAAFHGVSTQALLTSNNLSWNSMLYEGQKLIVPISHGPQNCPALVKINPVALGTAQKYFQVAKEQDASDYLIVNALCLEMQRSGLVPEFGALAGAKELISKLSRVIGLETINVKQVLTEAGFEKLASGAALWEPSAWVWLLEAKAQTNV
jgi:hypothetical protein